MHRSMLVVLSLFVAGCEPASTDGEPGDEPVDEGTCVTDDDCGDRSICEDDACREGDRNDTVEAAEPLFWEETVGGEINPAGDVDWFAVEADGGEFVRISVVTEELEGGLDSVLSVYDSAGHRVVWEDEHPAGNVSSADSMCFAYFAEAGTYYLKVEDAGTFYGESPVGGSGEAYTLELTRWNSVGVEPDSAQSVGLDFGSVTTNVLYSMPVLVSEAGDTDWAAFDLPAAATPIYVVALTHAEESDLVPRVTMRNRDGDDVLAITEPSSTAPGVLPDPEGTAYVVGATDASGGGGADHWTWLFLVLRDPGDGYPRGVEPDDTLEEANVLTLTDEEPDSGAYWTAFGQGRVSTGSDVDLYAFDVSFEGAYVNVFVGAQELGSLLVPRIEVLDATGATIDVAESTVGTDVDALDLGPYASGRHYFRVTAGAESTGDGGEGSFYLFGLYVTSSPLD